MFAITLRAYIGQKISYLKSMGLIFDITRKTTSAMLVNTKLLLDEECGSEFICGTKKLKYAYEQNRSGGPQHQKSQNGIAIGKLFLMVGSWIKYLKILKILKHFGMLTEKRR